MSRYVDLVVAGDPARARTTIAEQLTGRGFRITWSDEWVAVAERGSKGANAVLGAMAQYFKVGLRVFTNETAQTVVRLETQSSGWMGGAIGAHRTKTNFECLRDDLWATYYAAGVLVAVNQG
jgi:hypothetical protein